VLVVIDALLAPLAVITLCPCDLGAVHSHVFLPRGVISGNSLPDTSRQHLLGHAYHSLRLPFEFPMRLVVIPRPYHLGGSYSRQRCSSQRECSMLVRLVCLYLGGALPEDQEGTRNTTSMRQPVTRAPLH
jgi:hypothetical protein